MRSSIRLTSATLDVLRVFQDAGSADVYGLQLVADTGRPSGTVYPLLSRLEEAGWIEGHWEGDGSRGRGPRRRYYRVTQEGADRITQAVRIHSPTPSSAPQPPSAPGLATGAPVTPQQVIAGFLAPLQRLRERAGNPSLRRLAALTFYSPAALSEALSGRSLPSERLVRAYVSACGGDPDEWTLRRSLAEQSIESQVWLPFSFEDFYPLGVRWARAALAPLSTSLSEADVEDISHETLLTVFEIWRRGPELRRVVSATALRHGRRRARTLLNTAPLGEADTGPVLPDIAEEVAGEAAARDLLRDLSRSSATIIRLSADGHGIHEIARLIGLPVRAVKNRRNQAVRSIRGSGLSGGGEESQLRAYLGELRRRAGMPSLRWIAVRIGYSHTHVAAVLGGTMSHPSWRFTERYVHALNGATGHARFLWEQLHAQRDVRQPASYSDVAAKSGDTFALWNMADRLEQAGRTDDAASVWQVAAESGNTYAMTVMADLLDRANRISEAERWLRAAAEAGDTDALHSLSGILEREGRVEEAKALWKDRAEADPRARTELARLLERAGLVEEAIAVWRAAAASGGTYPTRELVRILLDSARVSEVVDAWRHAAGQGNPFADQELLDHLMTVDDLQAAFEQLHVLGGAATPASVLRLSAKLEKALRVRDAESILREASASGGGWAIHALAGLLRRSGRLTEAVDVLLPLAHDRVPEAMGPLATMLEDMGLAADAAAIWRTLAQASGDADLQREATEQADRIAAALTERTVPPPPAGLWRPATRHVEDLLRRQTSEEGGVALLALSQMLDGEGRAEEADRLLSGAALKGDALAAEALARRRKRRRP
ncbi:helix-turn-helix domain-containing protein [Herbidospora mongoliensis]|uniref:helix-turn-helix domain-containing protein n=1 Tax=Herbidospora mongoliensis TaxID=688067 RepID=UPI000833DCB2|nr:helix-turn-helix domain-containing protein [Herbidospora mongoliensis]